MKPVFALLSSCILGSEAVPEWEGLALTRGVEPGLLTYLINSYTVYTTRAGSDLGQTLALESDAECVTTWPLRGEAHFESDNQL